MDAKEIRMYIFFSVGGLLLVDHLRNQVIDVIREGARAAGNGVGGGLIDGLQGMLANLGGSRQ